MGSLAGEDATVSSCSGAMSDETGMEQGVARHLVDERDPRRAPPWVLCMRLEPDAEVAAPSRHVFLSSLIIIRKRTRRRVGIIFVKLRF